MLESQLKYSFTRNKPITIMYLKGMEVSKRNIQVLKLEKDYIKAIDLDKRAIRTFKKDNILSAMDIEYSFNHRSLKINNHKHR